jgi:hypothetical protein
MSDDGNGNFNAKRGGRLSSLAIGTANVKSTGAATLLATGALFKRDNGGKRNEDVYSHALSIIFLLVCIVYHL